MTRIFTLIAVCTALTAGCSRSQEHVASPKQTPPIGNEPGVEQARQTTDRPAITTFTHPAVEARGVWLPSRDILVPRDRLLAKLDQLQAAGFNRVLVGTQFRGYVLYPGSAILPQIPEANGEDLLKLIIDECHRRGMKADAWMEYGFYAYFTDKKDDPSMGAILDADPSLLSVDANDVGAIARPFGTFYSLDPAHPQAIEVLAKLNAEVASRYDIDAINLDRIRFAAWDHLSLVGRARFEKETGLRWANFPKDSAEGRTLSEWKRQQTLIATREIANAIRQARPGLPVTSYVVPPEEMDDKSQSWDLWMKDNLLDGLAVSMYGADIIKPANEAIALLGGDKSRLIAAVNAEQTTRHLTTNIELSRQLGLPGQYVWYSGAIDEADVKALTEGPYAKPAKDTMKAKPKS